MIEKPLNNLNLDVDHQIILYLENISVSFDGFKVIDDLNLYIEDGELLKDNFFPVLDEFTGVTEYDLNPFRLELSRHIFILRSNFFSLYFF